MKISRPKRVSSANASKDAREAIDTVGLSTNTFMNEAYIAIMGNLNVSDNLNMQFVTVDVNVDVNGFLNRAVKFSTNLKTRAVGTMCIRVSQAIPTGAPFITYTEGSGIIEIQNIKGLAADTDYQLVLLLIGL